jgi:hypothetical protein
MKRFDANATYFHVPSTFKPPTEQERFEQEMRKLFPGWWESRFIVEQMTKVKLTFLIPDRR